MKCLNSECGVENPRGAKFCRACGSSLEEKSQLVACPKCGRENPVGYVVCRKCGYEPVELKCPNCGNTDFESGDAFCWKCKAKLGLEGVSPSSEQQERQAQVRNYPVFSQPYASCQVDDHFFFGTYPQGASFSLWSCLRSLCGSKNNKSNVKPIEWRVLDREMDRLLVIAEYGLDAMAYNVEREDTNWSRCSLRSWLNDEFIEKAFNDKERGSLLEVTLSNPNSPPGWNNVPGGPNTCDKVFLLSMDEVKRFFSGDADRCCRPTDYAFERGAYKYAETCNCWWWLRSPGYVASGAADIYYTGSFGNYSVDAGHGAVRPAMYLAL